MSNIKIFKNSKIRTYWDAEKEEWYFSVVDVCGVLSSSSQPRKYWNDLKKKLLEEGSQLSDKIGQLKMIAEDGKMRMTDVLDTKGILRLVQSIPSPNAEPFKLWLADAGSDRLNEIADPEKAILRGADYYRKKGYTEGWIKQRLQTIEMRKELTDEWQRQGVASEKDFEILTNEMVKTWSGMTVGEYKSYKDITKENLRDNMTNIELVLNMLAEVTTTAISKENDTEDFEENKEIARRGGSVAKTARLDYEKQTNKKAISSLNAKNKELLEVNAKTRNLED